LIDWLKRYTVIKFFQSALSELSLFGLLTWNIKMSKVSIVFHPSQADWYSKCLSRRNGRLSWLWRLVIYRYGLPLRRQSPFTW